jgi:hypothetical protein
LNAAQGSGPPSSQASQPTANSASVQYARLSQATAMCGRDAESTAIAE